MNADTQRIREQFEANEAVCSHVLALFNLIANKGRFRIICMLAEGEFCVQEIVETVACGKLSNISQQLKILTLAGLLQKRRDRRHCYYSLKDMRLKGLIQYLREQFLERPNET